MFKYPAKDPEVALAEDLGRRAECREKGHSVGRASRCSGNNGETIYLASTCLRCGDMLDREQVKQAFLTYFTRVA